MIYDYKFLWILKYSLNKVFQISSIYNTYILKTNTSMAVWFYCSPVGQNMNMTINCLNKMKLKGNTLKPPTELF